MSLLLLAALLPLAFRLQAMLDLSFCLFCDNSPDALLPHSCKVAVHITLLSLVINMHETAVKVCAELRCTGALMLNPLNILCLVCCCFHLFSVDSPDESHRY